MVSNSNKVWDRSSSDQTSPSLCCVCMGYTQGWRIHYGPSCLKKRVWCSGWLCSQMANVKSGAEASYSLNTAVRYALQKVKKWPQSFLGQLWTSCEASSYMADNFAFCDQFDLNWQWQWEVGYSQWQQWLTVTPTPCDKQTQKTTPSFTYVRESGAGAGAGVGLTLGFSIRQLLKTRRHSHSHTKEFMLGSGDDHISLLQHPPVLIPGDMASL